MQGNINFMICGGRNSESQILSTRLSGKYESELFPKKSHDKQFLSEDKVERLSYAFPVSEEILTPKFVCKNVLSAKKRAILLDLKRPRIELLGVVSNYGNLHLFDKTHCAWLSFIKKQDLN